MTEPSCRACHSRSGAVVLDLGAQPTCEYFPAFDDPGPDPVYPLQMWLCSSCGLAQLASGPTVPEEPQVAAAAALVAQIADAVQRVGGAGLLPSGARVAEYGSPHGGSWLGLLMSQGMRVAGDHEPAEVIVDCIGLMHAPDQAGALAARAARLTGDGVLLLQYHSLETIVRRRQCYALRHGHYAYYSATALTTMLAGHGLVPFAAWLFDLYGGSVLLAARRGHPGGQLPDRSVEALLEQEARAGVRDAAVLCGLQRDATSQAAALHAWLSAERASGHNVLGYAAASRAVAQLVRSGVDSSLLPAVADSSQSKQGLRMPGTDIPIISPAQLAARRPHSVLLFVPDLLEEVRSAYPEIEASGSRWVDAESLSS
ncbi:MAG TPA: methyltransferase domain-containing protein [Acidimicrobiales bacterium]|nr:methyltransferase domain-containing protein [Acidimicrobiales bacterium]